ncbi:hypothetical protein COU58_02550 [Candidatus Pacearchaeota archaeon CG10_big_fil_rev_8_21_14_0_10_32_42]|nr:MAG: hypothetical protein COU58_02550 [Candidatus Pacearchaeota archaeon CG10_big_fil_rev_8_21_14_0_10_32_42]
MSKIALIGAVLILSVFLVSAVGPILYDNFSSGKLNPTKWEVRQDTEGQPLMDKYGVLLENGNFVFHTEQIEITDRRVYLFPKINFTTGDSIEYDNNLISREGNHAQMVLLTGDQYIRIGMRGTDAGFDELGVAHMKLTFLPNLLVVERWTPSGQRMYDELPLDNTDGTYQLYIGSFSDGRVHMDFDNFWLNGRPMASVRRG